MRMFHFRAIGTLVLALLLAPASYAQNNDKVLDDLSTFIMMLPEDYYVVPTHWGWLNDDENETFSVYLNPGDYAVAVSCDEDCTDVDLVVTGMEEVGSDREMDDIPYLYFSVSSAGYFTIRIEMATCTREPCHWGADVYQRLP